MYDFRARVWSPELAAFLQPDEFGFLSPSGTLWSWPGQNPFRWRDPSGRGAIGRFIGTIIGGVVGADVGAVGGAAVGGGTTWETGPGVVVSVTGGALVGTVTGAAAFGTIGGNAGDKLGDALASLAASAGESIGDALDGIYLAASKKGKRGSSGCPDAIANTKKSEDRLRNRLNRVENQSEADEEFGDPEDEVGPGD